MTIQDQVRQYLETQDARFSIVNHPPCHSSEESAAARAQGGAGQTLGAKALLVKTKRGDYAVCVLPGTRRLDSARAKAALGGFRFARRDEMKEVTGLEPGSLPPFGSQIFEGVSRLLVDPAVGEASAIGFNMACPTASVVMTGAELMRIIREGAEEVRLT